VTPKQRLRRLVDIQRELLRRGGLERCFRLTVPSTPSRLQRAILMAADGRPVPPDVLDDGEVERYFGCDRSRLGLCRPVLVAIIAGVRGGKSLLASVAATNSSMVADTARLLPQQLARTIIVAPKIKNAKETFRHSLGGLLYSPGLRSCMVAEPIEAPTPLFRLKRPDGRRIDIEIVAADQGGLGVRSGWLSGFVLEEAALFGESGEGAAVNAEDILHAAETRLLPRGQGWIISSPYGPQGLLWSLYNTHFGKPGRTLVVHAPTRALNPSIPEEEIEAVRLDRPDVAAREYDAEWIDADTAFFEGTTIDACTRADPLERPPQPGSRYIATMDQATRGNAWTLTIARDKRGPTDAIAFVEIGLAREWVGSRAKPLSPKMVLAEIRDIIAPYGLRGVNCDAWAIDPLKAIAVELGLVLREHEFSSEDKTEVYRSTDSLLRQSRLELPPHAGVTRDLRSVRRKASAKGVTVHLPTTSDGRHCDFAPSVSLATWLLGSRRKGGDPMSRAMRAVQQRGGPSSLLDGMG
jgi:hypothetical protein